jgi:hypothetical protein
VAMGKRKRQFDGLREKTHRIVYKRCDGNEESHLLIGRRKEYLPF